MEDMGEDTFWLYRIFQKPSIVRQMSRAERVHAFSQFMMVGGAIVPALLESTDKDGPLRDADCEHADDFWTVKELAAKLRLNVRTVYLGIKSGKYPFAVVDGRNIRISRLGFQRWAKNHTSKENYTRIVRRVGELFWGAFAMHGMAHAMWTALHIAPVLSERWQTMKVL